MKTFKQLFAEGAKSDTKNDGAEYKAFFAAALKKFGVSSPGELKGEDEKKFYDYIDANWEADDEQDESWHSGKKKKMKEGKIPAPKQPGPNKKDLAKLQKLRKMLDKAGKGKKEGNAFTGALMAAKEKGDTTFIVSGKKYKVEDYQPEIDECMYGDKDDFVPHKMYKDGKVADADTAEEHERLSNLGWTHEKPESYH
tara:strand:+ start:1495 stop:2085 length:591 start_codon:yes stop_codon:yes gene_type:complete